MGFKTSINFCLSRYTNNKLKYDIFVEEKEQKEKEEYASEQYWKELLLSKYQYHDKLFLLLLSSVLL